MAAGDPQSVTASYAFTSGNGLVDQNANELWSVLVCKPWLYGELGTTQFAATGSGAQTVVNSYGRQLLWSQAIAANETPTTALIQAKQATYAGIASALQTSDPAVYPLFQGNQWTTRLEIAFAAMFAAVVAGLLILLIALTLIVLKIGFLLLLVAGPFFLIIGTHPGFGRIIAIRWFEMLAGVLMKQVAVAITLSVLLYCYSLIMGTSDAVLPWALKILMIALVTVAVFIYRKPFTHLFSAVGYGSIGSHERAEYSLREASSTFRRSTRDAATVAIPAMATYRAARWARRSSGSAAVGRHRHRHRGRGRGRGPSRRVRRHRDRHRAGRGQRLTVPARRPTRGRRGRRGRRGCPAAHRSRRLGPEHARDRRQRPHGTAPGPAAPDRHRRVSRIVQRGLGLVPRGGTLGRIERPAKNPVPRTLLRLLRLLRFLRSGRAQASGSARRRLQRRRWPSTGWSGAGPRQRSAIAPKPNSVVSAPPRPAAAAAARPTGTVRKNSHPCRSGSVRYGGTSSGRSLWISALASAARSSPSSSWCLPCSATSWWCRR